MLSDPVSCSLPRLEAMRLEVEKATLPDSLLGSFPVRKQQELGLPLAIAVLRDQPRTSILVLHADLLTCPSPDSTCQGPA